MSKIIDFPTREKRLQRLLREQLPVELPSDAIEELATELRKSAERIEDRPKSFTLHLPQTYSQRETEYVTKQVEEIVDELMNIIKDEESEIFNLIIRFHLLLHEARQLSTTE